MISQRADNCAHNSPCGNSDDESNEQIMDGRTHYIIIYIDLKCDCHVFALKFLFTRRDNLAGVRSAGYSANGKTVWQPFLYSLHP